MEAYLHHQAQPQVGLDPLAPPPQLEMISIPENMQPDAQQVYDDLASLFSRTLTFTPDLRASAANEAPRQEPPWPAANPLPSAAHHIVYSVSQHYHHSAHQQQRPDEPLQNHMPSLAAILVHHGIDAATLTPSQLQLFSAADGVQKQRLIELWNICPPERGDGIPAAAWSSSSLEQEESLARVRVQRQQQIQAISLDGTPVQVADGRCMPYALSDPEPYVLSGYEELMRREQERDASARPHRELYSYPGTAVGCSRYTPATDPVYMGPDLARRQQHMDMATQYGALDRLRRAAEVDAMEDV